MENLIKKIFDKENITKRILNKEDIFDRNFKLIKVDLDNNFPEYILKKKKNSMNGFCKWCVRKDLNLNLLIRSQTLYPVELRTLKICNVN